MELVINIRGNIILRLQGSGFELSAALMNTPLFFTVHAQISHSHHLQPKIASVQAPSRWVTLMILLTGI